MSLFAGQFAIAAETTWGTAVTVTRFVEHESCEIQGVYDRVWSKGIKPSKTTWGADSYLPVAKGAEGTFSFTPGVVSFGLFLKAAMGAVSTGSAVTGRYPHTFTRAATTTSFTAQVVRPYVTAGSDPAFTYNGCKVRSMTLSQDVDGLMMAEFDVIAKAETTATGTASASYASGQEYFNWNTTSITIGGTSVCASGWELSINNNLKDDRFKLCSSGAMDEPINNGYTEDRVTLKGIEFNNLTHYNRVAALTQATSQATIVITCTGTADPLLKMVITITSAVAISDPLPINSENLLLEQDLEFMCTTPTSGTTTAVQIVYTSTDATP